MTQNYGSRAVPTQLWQGIKDSENKDARDCMMSMGMTAENVARRYDIPRSEQDAFASRSQNRAVSAQNQGLFDSEIVPVSTSWTDPKGEDATPQQITVTRDDGVRETTAEKLSSMKPAFLDEGTVTAGNSSQISDGASAALMMRRSTATSLGLSDSIIGRWVGSQVVGCAPDQMGIGPALAVPKLLLHTGISKSDVGLWELNEAFAAQSVYCMRNLGLDEEKVNVKGGAIALGHPLGATGGRMLATLLPEMGRRGLDLGVLALCIGTGMGQATLIVRE